MNEIAYRQRIEDERVVAAFGRAPAQAVVPDEAERIAQELAKGACRLGARQDGLNYRMVGANEAVMRGDLLPQPVAPAGGGRGGLRQGAEFLRPGRQSVGLAEGVIRYPIAPEIDLIRLRRQEGAAAEEPAIAVSSRPRQDNLALAGREDGCEILPIGCADGDRVELGRGDNVN